jgi:hypothetical protein
MGKAIFLLFVVVSLTSSCAKNYKCYCTNSNGEYYAGEIEDTESNARNRCHSLGNSSTTCDLK